MNVTVAASNLAPTPTLACRLRVFGDAETLAERPVAREVLVGATFSAPASVVCSVPRSSANSRPATAEIALSTDGTEFGDALPFAFIDETAPPVTLSAAPAVLSAGAAVTLTVGARNLDPEGAAPSCGFGRHSSGGHKNNVEVVVPAYVVSSSSATCALA